MDVGNIVRALLGAQQPADKKLVELKAGQVVRGVLMQMLTESEGLVNILGTTVRARLETPLAQGQSTLLQVQPETANGTVVLKPLASSSADIAPESIPEVLKSVGLKDSPLNRAVVKGFHQDGVVLSKELAKEASAAVQGAGAFPAASVEGDEAAVKAAAVAAKRGLPLTPVTVSALRAAMFGDGPSELLNRVAEEARAFVSAYSSDESSGGRSGVSQQLASQTLSVLGNKDAIVSALLRQDPETGGKPLQAAAASASSVSAASIAVEERGGVTPLPGGTANEQAALGAQKPGGSAVAAAKPPLLALLQWLGVDLEKMASKPSSATVGPSAGTTASGLREAHFVRPEAPVQGAAANAANSAQSVQPAQPVHSDASTSIRSEAARGTAVRQTGEEPHPLPFRTSPAAEGGSHRTASDDGITQHKAMRTIDAGREASLTGIGALGPAQDAEAASERPAPSWAESLKATLLQLQGADDVPQALREAAQQAVQWITGQQLLLSTERGNPFVFATMFVPFGTPEDGSGGNASVHIQTRKGRRGEWDADNCRLWFDLRLARIGETRIDVQVTNKLVSLHVFNDKLDSMPWLEENKAAIEAALESIGYRLSAARTSPIPEPESQAGGGTAGFRRTAAGVPVLFGGSAYKGVDVRV
ncbi:hypothetical protein [Paenibacillus thermotolerans]|uniref:hypothetical protein n=1 Tax=Paenibacillus thermotolerans TaxID=3027807 RepID=UPI00236874A8|nr:MULTISPECIES: hypothetical protein [unclassified Paenibacillus]